MTAFHHDPQVKAMLLARLQQHYDADEIVKGVYWENGKGCDMGCSLYDETYDEDSYLNEGLFTDSIHTLYEQVYGIPAALAYLFDTLFEGLPNADAKEFPLQHTRAIAVGADLSLVLPRFLLWLLTDATYGVWHYADAAGQAVIEQVATLYRRTIAGEHVSDEAWQDARTEASRTARAAAARSATGSAARTAWAAEVAARTAAPTAATAASAAARTAAWAAEGAWTRDAYYRQMRTQVLLLLEQASQRGY